MKVLKNFKILKDGKFEEYLAVEIRMDDTEVFVDLPICMVEFNQEFEQPMLLGYNGAGIANIIERSELVSRLDQTKIIYFKNVNDEIVLTDEKTDMFTRFPKDEDPNKYMYDYRDGQVFVIEKIESDGE